MVAGAGCVSNIMRALKWIIGGEHDGARPDIGDDEDDGISLLRVFPDGTLVEYESSLIRLHVHEPRFAIGSGAGFAQAILDAGGTAVEAIEAAMKRDIHTGMGISVMQIVKPKRKRK
jgi:20S proteasome alpha/beta subunit